MTFTNSEKQARFRARNVIVLTDSAEDIAAKLIGMADKAKLAKIAMLIVGQARQGGG
jgi:hypothetical protein